MKLIKQSLLSLTLVLVLTTAATSNVAQAHVLKRNNDISGVLHIPPNDDPKAGEVTIIGVSFADKKGAFSLQDCDCKVELEHNDKVLQTTIPEPALAGATLDSYSKITFPRVGDYHIHASGASKTGAFSSFDLEYQVHVASGVGVAAATKPVSSKSNNGATMLIISIGSFFALAMVAIVAIGRGGRYKTVTVPSKKPTGKV